MPSKRGSFMIYLKTAIPSSPWPRLWWRSTRLPSPFFRGDANYDSVLDISDPVTVLRATFHGDATIWCDDAADANDDGELNISDASYIFNFLFLGGPPPRPPYPEPGSDPTDDALSCFPER